MLFIHQSLLMLHIVAGALALVLFWGPMLTKKGSRWHRRSGNWYSGLLHVIALSGMLMCSMVLLDPAYFKAASFSNAPDPAKVAANIRAFWTFLGVLSLLSWVAIRQAILVLRSGPGRQLLRTVSHLLPLAALPCSGLYLLYLGLSRQQPLFIAFALIAIVTATNMLRFIFKAEVSKMAILREHLGSMLGTAIAIYTAFSVFGGRELLALSAQGQVVSWLAPSVIGIIFTLWYQRAYQDVPTAAVEAAK